MLKIMIVGNSHSNDAFWLLHDAFRDQLPEQELTLGIMYYSGCSITRHITFTKEKQNVYRYYKNTGGPWVIQKEVTMEVGLQDENWDVVMLQAAKTDLDDTLNLAGRRELEGIIAQNVPQPYTLMWHTSWPSPNDPTFFSEDYVVQPPKGYQANLQRLYGHDPFNQFTVLTEKAKSHILTDSTYEKAICTGAGILNAYATQGIPQIKIWRDYTHLGDFGRLIAAYSFYTQFTGKPVDEIRMNSLPDFMRYARYQALGDMEITEEMKKIIITAANHALQDPWTVPAK